jgi:hypothetical protein
VGVVWVALVPVQVKPLQFHSYVPPPEAVKVIAVPTQTLDALRLNEGAAREFTLTTTGTGTLSPAAEVVTT